MNESYTVAASGSHEVSFDAQNIFVNNNTGNIVYVRIGSQQTPDAQSNDLTVFPFTQVSHNVSPATRFFGFAIGAALQPTAAAQGGSIDVVFNTDPQSTGATTVNTPGALFTPLWVFAEATFPTQASVTQLIAAPGAGHTIQIYKFMVTYLGNSTFQEFQIRNTVSGVAPSFLVSVAPGENGTQKTIPIDFGNGGVPVGNNSPLYFRNVDTAQQACFVGVQYSII